MHKAKLVCVCVSARQQREIAAPSPKMKMQAGLKCAVLMACLVSAVYGGNCPSGAQAAVCPDCVAGQYAGVADAADVAADCS